MKEFIAETGGRFTYTDDILNLQELAISFSAIFDECSNFVISGCRIAGNDINEGYVWINGKIRRFAGAKGVSFPYYIFEKNSIDTVTYANDVNKRGRVNYLCSGGNTIPNELDAVTNSVPEFIEIKDTYTPRLLDKFIGKYAVLLDSPFSKQTIKKDLVLSGKVTGETDIESKTAMSVKNDKTGYSLKNITKANGDGAVGLYLNGLLVNEIILHTNGSFSLLKNNQTLATIDENGIAVNSTSSTKGSIGKYYLEETIENISDNSDAGAVIINSSGYNRQGTMYRDFLVYDGRFRRSPLFKVEGKTESVIVDGFFQVCGDGNNISLVSKTFAKSDKRLVNSLYWKDNTKENIAAIGYLSNADFDFTLSNLIGNINLKPKGYLDIDGELKIKGISIGNIYVTQTNFTIELKKKVNIVEGKQLSTEDFTTEYKKKLDAIGTGNIGSDGSGYVSAKDVTEALNKKLSISSNLSDLKDAGVARTNLSVFSKNEINTTFLKISGNLQELVNLSADEINGLTPEEASALKASKQKTIRDVIDAEQKGTGELKLTKASNLSDLQDKDKARKNINVYSIQQIDDLLSGYLPNSSEYKGAIFTADHKSKLEAISTGNFAGVDSEGKAIPQKDGYALVSHLVKEYDKKANRLLDGYNDSDKKTIATNIDVYQKKDSDAKYACVEELFQDFITYLVKQGKTSVEAQQMLRDKLDAPSKKDVNDSFLRKDSKLSDLVVANAEAKKLICNKIGAAYSEEYQPKIIDTGWLKMSNAGGSTYASDLYIRQIGNIVSIQGKVYNNRHEGDHWGGTLALIPNQIQPPKYSLKKSLCDFNDDHKHNRGATYVIWGGDRRLIIYESGWYVATELNFTYMV